MIKGVFGAPDLRQFALYMLFIAQSYTLLSEL